jgi:hypothetical protein
MNKKPYYDAAKPKVWLRYFKYLLFVVIIFIPIAVVMFVFGPVAKKKTAKDINHQYDRYMLPKGFSSSDLQAVLNKMKDDREFAFYFEALDKVQIAEVSGVAFNIIKTTPQAEKLLEQIKIQKDKTQALSLLFSHLDYPKEFFTNPAKYPQLNDTLWEFLKEEFKLTILGAIYKANYNRYFAFTWDETAYASARKLRGIVSILKSKG